jgi:hypothetical protein
MALNIFYGNKIMFVKGNTHRREGEDTQGFGDNSAKKTPAKQSSFNHILKELLVLYIVHILILNKFFP